METRASHILVGGFVLLFLAGLIAFAIWVAKVDLDAEYRDYDIYFDGTVSGLYKRGTVYYLGIPVGEVRDITLAPHDPRKVQVWVRLKAEVPVHEGALARLEFQGLTGVAYIELNGGPPDAPFITAKTGQERPVIPAEASAFQEIYENAPNLVDASIAAVGQIKKLLNDENLTSVAAILKNSDRLSANLARGTDDLDKLLATAHGTLEQVNETATALTALANSGDQLVKEDITRLVAEATATLENTNSLVAQLDQLVAANGETITQFVSGSLPEVSRMIMDLRATARKLSRLVSRIEKNPAEAIFGQDQEEYDMKTRKKEGGK